MFSHMPSPISLSSMATRLSQIRFLPASSKQSSKNPPSNPPRASKSSSKKKPMYTAHSQRTRVAHQHQHQHQHQHPTTAQPQQAGTRRSHRYSDLEDDGVRERPGGARPLPATPRSDHYLDWHRRDEARLMEEMEVRVPMREVDGNSGRATPRGPRSRRSSMEKQRCSVENVAMTASQLQPQSQSQPDMSQMHLLIDDYLKWNNSSSDLGLGLGIVRPDSSGTMFVDFASNGEMEVSYRNGVNKKLPVPPPPPKPSTSSNRMSLDQYSSAVTTMQPQSTAQQAIKPSKPLPRPPQPRHDSGIACDPKYEQQAKAYSSRPLPRLPSQTPRHSMPVGRKMYPPQTHRTQRSSSYSASTQPAPPPHASPAPSYASMSTYHTAPSPHNGPAKLNGEAYSVTDPTGLTVHIQPSFRPQTIRSPSVKSSQAYICGHDAATNYVFDYDGTTMHVHRSPSSLRPESWTSEYFDVGASQGALYGGSSGYSPEMGRHRSEDPGYYPAFRPPRADTSSSAENKGGKALPPLPRGKNRGYQRLPEPPRADVKKRRKVFAFVQKLLHKLEDLGVVKA